MKNPKFRHAFEVVADLPDVLTGLKRLARNFRWSWDSATRDLFRSIDKHAWNATGHNPIAFLNSISADRLQALAEDSAFVARLRAANESLDLYLAAPTWFDQEYPGERASNLIAYFCFEFGITEGLPIYSGGLGVLAGDHLKAASDLGLPLVGVGLLYNRGYFRQRLTFDGWQQEVYPQYDFYQMPLTLMRREDGTPIRVAVEFPDREVTLQVWRADVGRIPLYLLDSNVLENQAADQSITDSLYSGDEEMRIRQEMILGIGGMRALQEMGISPTVCHMNEGHAAFLSLERIRQVMTESKVDFRTARQVVSASNVFTTHTPVPAGFDLFRSELLERYLGRTVGATGLPFGDFIRLGRINPDNTGEAFNMAVLAMETADRVNSVSKLHAKVTRAMFSDRWPQYPEDEVPIVGITNGIHTMTWVSRVFGSLFDTYLDPDWRRRPQTPGIWDDVAKIPDEELWAAREFGRTTLIRFIRNRLRMTSEKTDFGEGPLLDPRVLTIGFARRFATYKRGSLMLSDRERLKSLLKHAEHPVQIVISGKAHPRDDGGKHIIQDLFNFAKEPGVRTRIVFLEDYDMQVARTMVQGVDVWLNNPRRPHEASGTSGMKVIPNGGLNCSILDGWWDEGYEPGLGWAIGDRTESSDEGHQDWLDSQALYSLLEQEIAPLFYQRNEQGVPAAWCQMIKQSIIRLAPQFSTARMVQDYSTEAYVPAMRNFTTLTKDGLAEAKSAIQWRDRVQSAWPNVRILEVTDDAGIMRTFGEKISVSVTVELGSLTADEVKVQAVAGKVGANRELSNLQSVDLAVVSTEGSRVRFSGEIVCDVPGHQGYTVRVVPYHPIILVASELPLAIWE